MSDEEIDDDLKHKLKMEKAKEEIEDIRSELKLSKQNIGNKP